MVLDTWVNRQSRSLHRHRPQYPSRRNGWVFRMWRTLAPVYPKPKPRLQHFSKLLMAKRHRVELLLIEGMGVGGRGDGTPVKRRRIDKRSFPLAPINPCQELCISGHSFVHFFFHGVFLAASRVDPEPNDLFFFFASEPLIPSHTLKT